MLLLEVQEKKDNKFRTCEQLEMFIGLQLYQFIEVVKKHKTIKLQDNYYLVNVL